MNFLPNVPQPSVPILGAARISERICCLPTLFATSRALKTLTINKIKQEISAGAGMFQAFTSCSQTEWSEHKRVSSEEVVFTLRIPATLTQSQC
jgi:hypothetical protein